MGARRLGELTSPEVTPGTLLVVPLGSTEQHGPHLPLDTDTRVAAWLVDRLVADRPQAVVAPAIPFGSSGEHAGFPGTLSMGRHALELTLLELVRSTGTEFSGVVLVCAHGGNRVPLERATARLRWEGHAVLAWSATYPGDLHAGRSETSMMLALAPGLVRLERAAKGDTRPASEILAVLERDGVRAVSPNGVLGDPAGASRQEGRRLLADLAARLTAAVEEWRAKPPASP